VAIDPNSATTAPATGPIPVIENEIPAYRAISRAAVISLLLGLSSLFCFADFTFLVLAVGAVVAGFMALRKIRQVPEILTGAGLARVGIALGLIFGFSSVTRVVAGNFLVDREAGAFATHYLDILATKPLSLAVWYQQPPQYRERKGPDDVIDELKKAPKSPGGGNLFQEQTATLTKLKDRIKAPNVHVHYSGIETKAADGLTQHANALVEIDNPADKDPVSKEEFALLELTKPPGGGQYDWMVKKIHYPYKPASASAAPLPKADDGHGHGH